LTPFKNIVGQETVKKILLNSFNKNRLASTYLFYGPDGVGKWSTALALTALVNCPAPVKDETGSIIDACGQCTNCRQIMNLTFSEFHPAVPLPPHKSDPEAIDLATEFIESKKKEPYGLVDSKRQLTIPIQSAREIKKKAAIKPTLNLTRVIFFYQMEKMLAASADSLLKLIEEPPPNTIIILTAQDPDNLLPTIQYRSQRISFKNISPAKIAEYICGKYNISMEKAKLYARLAEGSIGRAINLTKDDEDSPVRQVSFLMFKALIQKDTASAVATMDDLINFRNRGEIEQVLLYWQTFMADIVQIKYGRSSENIINIDFFKELEILSARIEKPEDFDGFVNQIANFKSSFGRNIHARPGMISLIFQLRKYIHQSS
jgi:DNA polymerase-3 subunit delta'